MHDAAAAVSFSLSTTSPPHTPTHPHTISQLSKSRLNQHGQHVRIGPMKLPGGALGLGGESCRMHLLLGALHIAYESVNRHSTTTYACVPDSRGRGRPGRRPLRRPPPTDIQPLRCPRRRLGGRLPPPSGRRPCQQAHRAGSPRRPQSRVRGVPPDAAEAAALWRHRASQRGACARDRSVQWDRTGNCKGAGAQGLWGGAGGKEGGAAAGTGRGDQVCSVRVG